MSDTIGFAPGAESAPSPKATVKPRRPKKPKKDDQDLSTLQYTFKQVLPADGLLALDRALRRLDIVAEEVTIMVMGMFGPSPKPFDRREVTLPSGEVVSIGDGGREVPGLGKLMMKLDDRCDTSLVCRPNAKGWDDAIWQDLLAAIKDELTGTMSIFNGSAVRIESADDVVFPKFVDVSKPMDLILNPITDMALKTNLFDFIEHHDALAASGMRMKRGVIVEGHYGCGKSTAAYMAAKMCVKHKRAFISVNAGMTVLGMDIARAIQPALLFVEDIDAESSGHRDRLHRLLNTLSGIEAHGADLLLLVSTNFLDRMDWAFLRPDRIDKIITMDLPQTATIRRLLELTLTPYLAEGFDWAAPLEALEGRTPAIITEAANLARIRAIIDKVPVTTQALVDAATSLHRQRDLAAPVFKNLDTPKQLAEAMYKVVQRGDFE